MFYRLLVCSVLVFASASYASDDLLVKGKKAVALFDALKDAGVKPSREKSRFFNISVRGVECEYVPDGYIWSRCDLFDTNHNTGLRPFTHTAFNLMKALTDAGVGSADESRMNVASIKCKQVSDTPQLTSCLIKL